MPVFDHTNLLCSCNTRFGLEFDTTMQKIQFLDNIELNVVEKFPLIFWMSWSLILELKYNIDFTFITLHW